MTYFWLLGSRNINLTHCIRPEELRVRLGEWDVNNDSEFFPNVEFDVLSMKVHPDYYPGNLYNDLAVIKIDGFVDFARNAHISPVCLPDAFQVNRNFKHHDDSNAMQCNVNSLLYIDFVL